MAQEKKKTVSSKKTNGNSPKRAAVVKNNRGESRKSTGKKNNSKQRSKNKKDDNVSRELRVMGYSAVAIILFMLFVLFPPDAMVSGIGVVGIYLSNFFALLFGKGRFVFPLLLLAMGFFIWEKDKEKFPVKRCTIFSVVLFIALITFMNIDQTPAPFMAFISEAALGKMGGVVGGLFSYILLLLFGEAVSVIILLFLIIASLVAVTGLSFFGLMRKTGKGVSDAANSSVKAFNKAVKDRKEREPKPKTKRKLFKPTKPVNEDEAPLEDVIISLPDETIGEDELEVFIPDEHINKEGIHSFREHLSGEEDSFISPIINDVNEVAMPLKVGSNEDISVNIDPKEFVEPLESESIEFEDISPFKNDDGYDEEKLDILTYDKEGKEKSPEKSQNITPQGETEIKEEKKPVYVLPKTKLLPKGITANNKKAVKDISASVAVLENTLLSFGVDAKVTEVTYGPSLTRYEVQPGVGVKVSKIVNLVDDIALKLAATAIRIEAPVPGKSVIGIEVPRSEKTLVAFRDIIENSGFFTHPSKLTCALGKDITGKPVIGDLAEMPHLLIAGTTGSGKSVCVNTIICSILFKASPDEVKFIMIDPKQVEFVVYEGLPHLITPVVTDPKKAAGSLKWVMREMENRYTLFNQNKVRNLEGYNNLVGKDGERLPQIVVFIDELADLMMVAAKEVEDAICRLAQKARAAGIHLVVATQRPSVDVITGLIKANMPSRIALSVSSQTDSRTILDMGGAEKLMGKGDMLYFPVGTSKPLRVQGAFLDETVIKPIVEHCKTLSEPDYIEGVAQPVESAKAKDDAEDILFYDAAKSVINAGQASASMLQRRFRIGYNRAARLIEELQEKGIVGPSDGSKPRVVLMSVEAFEAQYEAPAEDQSLFKNED
ncbi:MAG: DNA translocase FtsK [Clostridiales bacterium]